MKTAPARPNPVPANESLQTTIARLMENLERSKNASAASATPSSPTPPNGTNSAPNSDSHNCPRCGGNGWFTFDPGDPDIPAWEWPLRRCPNCVNLLELSGLKGEERKATISSIRGSRPVHTVLRVTAGAIVQNAMGFCTVYGSTGTAKSLWAQAIVTGLCGRGIRSKYVHGKAVEQSLFRRDENNKGFVAGEQREFLCDVQALVVDEADKINWKSEWVSGELSDLFDRRFRLVDHPDIHQRKITVLVSQYHPQEWAPDFLLSRIRDHRSAVPWPNELTHNEYVRDGFVRWPLEVGGPDVRQVLPSQMQPVRVDPRTGEVIE